MHLLVGAQVLKAIANGLWCHRLQPEPVDRFAQWFGATRVLLDQAKDQFTLAARVAGVDELADILAFGKFHHRVQACFGFVDRFQIEMRRNHRQVGKAPLATFHVKGLGCLDFQQVPDGTGHHMGVVLKMFVVFLKLARDGRQGAHDVLRHGRFFGNDQCFGENCVFHLTTIPFLAPTHGRTHRWARTRAPIRVHDTKF